ncbi:hypothetical protein H6G77_27900 [Aulosira sp. FACHB-615]|nr:hypothetical protein [Aulosira sp. FACHB-615]
MCVNPNNQDLDIDSKAKITGKVYRLIAGFLNDILAKLTAGYVYALNQRRLIKV